MTGVLFALAVLATSTFATVAATQRATAGEITTVYAVVIVVLWGAIHYRERTRDDRRA